MGPLGRATYIALVNLVLTSLRVNDRCLESDGERVDADTQTSAPLAAT